MMNKVKFNLKKVHYAKITEESGNITFALPVPIPGAVNLSLSAVGETTPFYADGMEYFTSVTNNGYEGDLEVALLPESFITDILGETLSTTDKVLVENASVQVSPFALLFEFDGDVKATRHVLYNCIATRPTIESSTSAENTEVKTDTLSLKAKPLPNGQVKAKTSGTTTSTVYDAWYTKVWEKDSGGI